MPRPTFILWDHDGVLVDTEEWYYLATQRALAELGIYLERDQYHRFRADGKSSWDLARQAGISDKEIARHKANRDFYYQDYLRNEHIKIPGVIDVLEKLHRHCRMAIVTTSKRTDFELIHRSREITRYMEFALTVEDYQNEKPAPDPYLAGLARFGAMPRDAVVVEDSEQGLRAAQAAGIKCFIVKNRFFGNSHNFSGAKRVISSIRELPDALLLQSDDPGGNRPPILRT
jgi:HAD superfamily hydrolase (TIGR01509 family)